MFLISLLLFVDSQPWLRYAVTSAMLGLLGWMALCPGNDRSRKKRNWIFIALLALSLFWLRYPILFYPRYLEIDEAQMLSQAITFQSHPIPWVDVDGTTSGPLNSYVLLWCVPLGLHPTYFTTRLFGLFCLAGMLGLLYLACQSVAGTRLARLCVLPTFLFFGFVTFYDWVHYTSEHLSLFLLAWVIYLLTRLRRSSDSLYCISLLGLLLGITPFAKLQSTLPAGFLGLLGIVLLLKQGRRKK